MRTAFGFSIRRVAKEPPRSGQRNFSNPGFACGRILLQELRDGTAFYYIRNVNSGHPGSITTVHASSAMLAVEQMTLLVKELEGGQDLARDDIRNLLVMLIDVIIQCKRIEGKFRVTEIYFDPLRNCMRS